MKLHEALRKTIRHFGVNVIEQKKLMSFLGDYKAFDDYPAVKEVMRAIATGDSGKKICLAADGSDEEFLRLASEIKETLVREKSFKEEFARYAVDSVSFALGIVSDVAEPGDHGYEAVQRNTGSQGSAAAQGSSTQVSPKATQTPAHRQNGSSTAFVVSGDTRQTASNGAESHRRFYRGHDLTDAFESGEFSKNVADGSFRDIFPGDYITRQVSVPDITDPDGNVYIAGKTYGIKFVIADLDYALNCRDSGVTAHHAVIVPEKPIFDSYMNQTNTTIGGYAGSWMHSAVMPAFAQGLATALGNSHLLNFSIGEFGQIPANQQSCKCRLMTLSMVFGQAVPDIYNLGFSGNNKCIDRGQLAAFRLNQLLQSSGVCYWVSDTGPGASSSTTFALVYNHGNIFADAAAATFGGGVRPFALLS